MDSRLLAGAYSKRYKYIEREEIENLKNRYEHNGLDVLAKARRLSQETNKRRKKAEQKLKQEQAREEKRRQEILKKRHQEQKDATEKFQRAHVSSGHHHSPNRYDSSPNHTGGPVKLEDALRLVRGELLEEQSQNTILRTYNYENAPDAVNRSHSIKTINGEHARSGAGSHHRPSYKHNHRHHHHGVGSNGQPLTGRLLDAALRAELIERSMHNLSSSRNRFEQQLEQHQQLLVNELQRSQLAFNQAIRKEIDADTKVAGMEDDDYGNHTVTDIGRGGVSDDDDDDDVLGQSGGSSCSLDSLEGEKPASLNSSNNSQTLRQRMGSHAQHTAGYQQETGREQLEKNGLGNTKPEHAAGQAQAAHLHQVTAQAQHLPAQQQQQQRQQSQQLQSGPTQAFSSRPASGLSLGGHVVGPIPQGYHFSATAVVGPSCVPLIQGSPGYHNDSDEVLSAGERRVTVGTALRLPQQSSEAPKQPAPALQYNSQLLASRKFEPRPNAGPFPTQDNFGSKGNVNSQFAETIAGEPLTSALTQNELPAERPKAHVYAWASPPPIEGELHAAPASSTMSSTKPSIGSQSSNLPSSYSVSVAADRVMATNLHPMTSRTISTAATTTWVYQTVNSPYKQEPTYSQATNSNVYLSQANGSNVYSSQANNNNNMHALSRMVMHGDAPQGPSSRQTAAGGTNLNGMGSRPSPAAPPSSFSSHQPVPDGVRQFGHSYIADINGPASFSQTQKGILSQGGLGLVNDHLSAITMEMSDVDRKIVVVEEQVKEVKGILKRADKEAKPQHVPSKETKFHVQDSLEIAKKQLQQTTEAVAKKKTKKKGVRFADMHYANVDEESEDDESDIMNVTAVKEEDNRQQSQQRSRPASARVTSTAAKPADSKIKGPRATSAGPSRQPPSAAARPKAAAHIIMSGDTSNQVITQYPNHSIHIAHGNYGHYDSGSPGIAIHKSQLEKKVVMINNNFMSRVPAYSANGASTSNRPAPVGVEATAYTAAAATTNTKTTTNQVSTAYPVSANGGSVSKTVAGDQGAGKWSGQASRATTTAAITTNTLPSHSHFSSYGSKAVFSETGLRIDRTPTDDEINNLWKNMRSMLDVSESKAGQQMQHAGTGSNNNSDYVFRPQVHLSQQYFDGTTLGVTNGVTRGGSGFAAAKPASGPFPAGGTAPQIGKLGLQGKNGYLQRYSLLQQRRTASANLGAPVCSAGGVVEQTVQPMAHNGHAPDPAYGAVNISYAPREEMSESMAEFLEAEQMLQTQAGDVRDSRVVAAMQSAGTQQEMYNSVRQKLARGGPSALSMEEQRLLESLDKLNERLKVLDNRTLSNNQTNLSNIGTNQQMFIHGSGFKGHQVLSSSRRNSATLKAMGRPVSARLLTRPYH